MKILSRLSVRELIVPGGMVLFALVYFANTTGLSGLAKVFPYSILALLVIFSLLVCWSHFKNTDEKPDFPDGVGPVIKVAVAATLFIIAGHWLGLLGAAAVFMAASSVLLGATLISATAVSVILSASFYLIFVLGLGLPL